MSIGCRDGCLLIVTTGAGLSRKAVLREAWAAHPDRFVSGGQAAKDIIEERITREQIAEAQRLSTEWIEAHPPGGN
jgi:hypothetical protein